MKPSLNINDDSFAAAAARVMERCDQLAEYSETTEGLKRTFCSPPMVQTHDAISNWMKAAALTPCIDGAGNLVGQTSGDTGRPVFMIGSHLDTVGNAGKYDGPLGVLAGLAIAELLSESKMELGFDLAVVGFSEEEGVRFNTPYIGSSAIAGCFDKSILSINDEDGVSIKAALEGFGCNPNEIESASYTDRNLVGFVEVHIEQGPVLQSENCSVGVVSAIAGQSRATLTFTGTAGHAGTVPMRLRKDALVGAAEFIVETERLARATEGLVATVGYVDALPNVSNVIAAQTTLRLDVRHERDQVREKAFESLLKEARSIGDKRGLKLAPQINLAQPAAKMDESITSAFETAIIENNDQLVKIPSGAGHDSVMMARTVPTGMLFVRCRDGISHHPDEHVEEIDVVATLRVLFNGLINFSHANGFA